MTETTELDKEFLFLHHVDLVIQLCEEFLVNHGLNDTSEDTASVPEVPNAAAAKIKVPSSILNPLHMSQLLFLIKLQMKSKKPRNINLYGHFLVTLSEPWCSSEDCPSLG